MSADDTHLTAQVRLRVATDNPGSPNIQAGLAQISDLHHARRHLRHRPELQSPAIFPPAAPSTAPSINIRNSPTAPPTSNDDRNFNQFGGVGRVSYDLMPGLKPFAEIEGDTRVHDLTLDRNGYARDSSGGYAKAGTSFEFTRLLTGEISVGYAARDYADPRLDRLQGLLVSSSLTWTASALTTAKFYSTTSIDETTLPGVPGVLTHTYTVEVDHDFRRWLTGDRQIHLRHARLPGRRTVRQNLLGRGRRDLQDDAQSLDQGHAAPRCAELQPHRQQHGLDGGDAGRAVAELGAIVMAGDQQSAVGSASSTLVAEQIRNAAHSRTKPYAAIRRPIRNVSIDAGAEPAFADRPDHQ